MSEPRYARCLPTLYRGEFTDPVKMRDKKRPPVKTGKFSLSEQAFCYASDRLPAGKAAPILYVTRLSPAYGYNGG